MTPSSEWDCLVHLKRFKEALAVYDQFLKPPDPDSAPDDSRPAVLRQRAGTRLAIQDFAGAEADLAAADQLKPATTEEEGNLAWAYVLARRPTEAQAAARRAIANGDAGGWIYINLADACLLDGKVEEARTLYLQHVNGWAISGMTGLQVIKDDLAEMRSAGIDLPAMKSIEALLPREVHPPRAATPPTPIQEPIDVQFANPMPKD